MDKQTRIGIGAGAGIAVALALVPFVSWWVSGSIMAICGSVAFWGFLPVFKDVLGISDDKPVVKRDVRLGDAIVFAVTGRWQRDVLWQNEGDSISASNGALKHFEQLATDGLVEVWGMANQNFGPYVKIPASHWHDHSVDYLSLFREKAHSYRTLSLNHAPGFFDLMVSKAQFMEQWQH